jgi:hypothetical protein
MKGGQQTALANPPPMLSCHATFPNSMSANQLEGKIMGAALAKRSHAVY